jgi:WD40 repeat protein
MSTKKNKRVRGLVLSRQGWQKVQNAKVEWEFEEKQGYKVTLEEIGDRAGLTTATVRKILTRDEGVDKRSIVTLFSSLNLELTADDCTRPDPQNKLNPKQTLRKVDWGESVDVSMFYGRTEELATLAQWLIEDRCREIAIIGMGGIGKTTLSVKLAQQIEDEFEYLIWRSLRDAPPIEHILTNLIQFLADKPIVGTDLPETVSEKISLLVNCLRSSRCLVILDNVESLLCDQSRAGICREEHQEYGKLFQRVGESKHQSCLLLTTREKPKEVAFLAGESFPVRSMQLNGFEEREGEKILQQKGLSGTETELAELVKHYNGNPLALKIAGTTIRDLFEGNIAEFLRQDVGIVNDIRDLLAQQFQRLLDIEKQIVYWLAINREPISCDQLQEDLVDSLTKVQLLDGLESLSRRCLIDKAESTATEIDCIHFTLQSVVMEYVINQLIEEVCQETVTQDTKLLRSYALMKATAKDYIKETQIRLILQPIIRRLLDVLGCQSSIEERFNQIIVTLQETSPRQTGYTAGNILNLLCYLETDLTGYDFSNLCIWQADLQNVCLHDVSFQNANLAKTVFSETFSGIISVAFSHDGKILAAGDSNGEIRLWRVADNQSLNIFRGHTNMVTSLNFSHDNMLLASGSSDSNVKLWNIETGQFLKTLEEHKGEVWSVIFSPNGEFLVTGSDDYTIRIWNVSTGECLKVFQEHTSWVTSLAFSFDGNMLVSGSDDLTIKLWDFGTGECLKVFQGHSDGVRSVVFSPDNQMLVSGSDDHTVKLWDVDTGECLKTFTGHTNQIFSVAFNPQGDFIASGCNDQTVKIWNINTGECIKTFEEHSNWVFAVAFHAEGNTLASGSRDQTVKLWSLSQGQCIKTFQGYSDQVLSVCFSPDSQKLASGSQDRTVKLWDVNTGQCSKILRGHLNWVYSVAFSFQGDRLVSGSGDKTIKLWDINTDQCLKTFEGHSAAVKSVAFSPNGKILASASEDHLVKLWDVNTGQVLRIFKGHQAAVWSVTFSPDGNTLASGSFDRTIKFWDVNTGQCLKTLAAHETWVWSIAFSPDGNTLASSSPDGTLKFWNVSTGECKKSLNPSTGWLLGTAFSPDGKLFTASSQDCTIKLWNASTHELIKTFSGHKGGFIWSTAFCLDSQVIVSGSDDETIKLWDIQTGNCLNTLKAEGLYAGLNLAQTTSLSESIRSGLRTLGIKE